MGRTKKTVQEKVQEEFPEFATEVASLNEDLLKNRLAGLAKAFEDSESQKDDDEDLEKAKSLASELNAPYRDAKKAIRAKSKYIVSILNERGAKL